MEPLLLTLAVNFTQRAHVYHIYLPFIYENYYRCIDASKDTYRFPGPRNSYIGQLRNNKMWNKIGSRMSLETED